MASCLLWNGCLYCCLVYWQIVSKLGKDCKMENEEILLENTEVVSESLENQLDTTTELEETPEVSSPDITMEILSDMMSDYLEEKGYILQMEEIEEREVQQATNSQELDPAALPESEQVVYPFEFTEDGFLKVQICNPLENIYEKQLSDYTISESLLVGILFVLLGMVIKNFLFSANFFRKGW